MSNFHTYGQEKMKSQFALGHQENYSFRISFKNVDEGMKPAYFLLLWLILAAGL